MTKNVLEQKLEFLGEKATELSQGGGGSVGHRQTELLLNEMDIVRAQLLQMELDEMYKEIEENDEPANQVETSTSGDAERSLQEKKTLFYQTI